jgi:Flp pilus assembly protein TadD
LQETGDLDSALINYRKALALKPNLPDTHYNLGMALMQKGQDDGAIPEFEHVLQAKGDDAETMFELGIALLRKGRISEALNRFEKVLVLDPNNVQNMNNLAWILSTCGQDSLRNGSKALALAQRALQMTGGGDAAVLRTLSAAFAETGRYDEAMAAASQALRLATDPSLEGMLKTEMLLFQMHKPLHLSQ